MVNPCGRNGCKFPCWLGLDLDRGVRRVRHSVDTVSEPAASSLSLLIRIAACIKKHSKAIKALKAIIRLFVRNLILISFWTMRPNPVSPEIFAGSHPGLSFGQGHTAYCSGQSSSTGSAQKLSQTRSQGVPGRRSPAKKSKEGCYAMG